MLACRENIERDIELERRRADNPDLMEEDVDAVPCITRYAWQHPSACCLLICIWTKQHCSGWNTLFFCNVSSLVTEEWTCAAVHPACLRNVYLSVHSLCLDTFT